MKEGIHPKYMKCEVTCSCGEKFITRSTKPKLHVEICSKCHPFFVGKQKLVDTGGRIERFQQKYGKKLGARIKKVESKLSAKEGATSKGEKQQSPAKEEINTQEEKISEEIERTEE